MFFITFFGCTYKPIRKKANKTGMSRARSLKEKPKIDVKSFLADKL